jgi:hypothetical protein
MTATGTVQQEQALVFLCQEQFLVWHFLSNLILRYCISFVCFFGGGVRFCQHKVTQGEGGSRRRMSNIEKNRWCVLALRATILNGVDNGMRRCVPLDPTCTFSACLESARHKQTNHPSTKPYIIGRNNQRSPTAV